MILSTPDAVTPAGLTRILRHQGCIDHQSVTGVHYEAIGIGLLGDTMRFHVEYDGAAVNAPRTIAGKFAATDPHARKAGAELGIYTTEINFYQQLARNLPVRVPHCYYAELDPASKEFGLLMEDIGPARAVDQMAGCSKAEAHLALAQAAALHAPRFNDASLWASDWLQARYPIYARTCADMARYIAKFRDRYTGLLEPEYMKLAEDFVPLAADFAVKRPVRFALVHADFRLDNMLFDAIGGKEPVVVLDWQSVTIENPGLDFAYLLGISYPIAERSRDEKDLLLFYHQELQLRGVRNYVWDDLWHDYRRGAWLGLMTAIFASAIAKQTERGDRLFLHMARAAGAQMLEHDTLSLA